MPNKSRFLSFFKLLPGLLLILAGLGACQVLPPAASKLTTHGTATSTPFRPQGTFTPTPAATLSSFSGANPAPTLTPLPHSAAQDAPTQVNPTPTQDGPGSSPTPGSTASPSPTLIPSRSPTSTPPEPAPSRTSPPSATAPQQPPAPTTTAPPPSATSLPQPPDGAPTPTATSAPPAPTATTAPTATSPPPPSATPAGCSYSGNASFENQVVNLINQERQNHGLSPLSQHASLRTAARRHSQDMACNDHFSHTGTDGSTLGSRLSSAGYSYTWAAENIAASSSQSFSPGAVVNRWMNSPGHKKNILSGKAQHIGVGFRYAGDGNAGDFDAYYTADFGRP